MEILLDTDVKEWIRKYFLIQNSTCSSGLEAFPLDDLILVSVWPASRTGSPRDDFGKGAHDV